MKPTVDQLFNAAVAMNLAKEDPEHREPTTERMLELFMAATWPTRLRAMRRVVRWRRSTGR